MKRDWTEESVREWIARRDAYRKRRGIPALATLRDSDDPKDRADYKTALSLERATLLERLHKHYTVTLAWSIEKHPVDPYPAPFAGTLYLPLNYRQASGVHKVKFDKGDDLNLIVFAFYEERVHDTYPGQNYVSSDGLIRRRSEYLGPSPHVAEYRFYEDRQEVFVEWWDAYLKVKWMNDTTWRIDMYFEERVQGWVSEIRGDYPRNLDLFDYAGTDSGK